MNWVWSGIEILVNLVEAGLFLYLVNSKFQNKTRSILPGMLALLVSTVGLSYIGLGSITWFPDFMVLPIVMTIYVFTSRSGLIWRRIFWVVIGTTLISATAVISIAVGLLLPGVTMEMILHEETAVRFQLLVFCKLMQAVLFFLLAMRKDSARLMSMPIIVSLILVPVTSILTVALLIEYGLGPAPSLAHRLLLVGASMSILVINLMVYFLYDSLSRQAEANLHMQARLQQNDMLKRHNEEISGLYEEMRGWRHDHHNHMQVIHGYLKLNKYDKLEEYLKEIENNISCMEMPVNSGNPLIDAILSSKILLAGKQDIQFDTDIQVPPNFNMNDTDMCVLLGNLLDNSIEACQQIRSPQTKRMIDVEMRVLKGHLHIMVRNSTNGVVRRSGITFISSKSGKHHGIGIKRIDEITAKYNGYLNRTHENSIFETNIMLPLSSVLTLAEKVK